MINLSKGTMEALKKTFAVLTAVTTIMSLSGVLLVPSAGAVAPADYGLREGDVVSAAGSDDPDVYIVNELGYKRLFLNPVIFGFYGHLGGFAAVKNVSPATRDAFPTSGLFRVDGTEKVYGVESTGEDTGVLHWVNTSGAQAVADDPNFFKKVFVINQNEFNWYSKGSDYTSVNQVPNYVRVPGTTPTGSVNVGLASGNPAAATITTNAQGVEFLKVNFTGNGTINSMTLKRLGPGSTDDFDNVYIYDGARRLTSGKSLSASTGEVTFISLNTSVSGSKVLSVVADMSSSAGNVDAFELTSVGLSSGTVSGLPVRGSNVTTSGATGGTVTLAKVGSIANPNVGQKNALVSEFKLTANTEAASVRRITMLQGGTVKPADSTNWKLKTGSTEWSGTIDSSGYVVFDMTSNPFAIAKGGEAIFYVYTDLAGKKDEDINLYFENSTDIHAIGDQFGFGMAATISDLDASTDAFDVTLQGGVLTIAFNGPSAQNIGTNVTDVTLLRYSITAATNIEVRKTKFVLCSDDDGSAVFDNSDAGEVQADWDALTDFKVTDENTGVTIIGPKDGTAFDDGDNTDASCGGTADGTMEYFTDVYELLAGKTYNYKVTADVNTANGGMLAAGDAIKIALVNFTAATGLAGSPATADVTVMKYAGTNTAVADADIVPQADISGPVMTLQASSLTLGLSSSVGDQTFVRGSTDKTVLGLTFKSGTASDLKVTDIVLTGYFDEDGTGDFSKGSDTTTSVADLVSSVSIYEVESGTVLSSTPASNQLSNTTGTVTFNNLNWNIPAGATKTLGVKVNLGNNSLANTDYFAFDIAATTDVTALDNSSKTVNAGNEDPNQPTALQPGTVVTVTDAGSMSVAIAPATPADHSVYWGQTGDEIGRWRFTGTNEGFFIETAQFDEDDAGQEAAVTGNVKTVYLEYKNKDGSTVTKSSTFNSAASVSFGFTGVDRPYVPKDGSLDVIMKADFKTKAEGATNNLVFDIEFQGDSGTGTNTFRAVGEGSGTVLQGNSDNITDQEQTTAVRVYRVYPEFAMTVPASTKLTTNDPVLTFTITAKGLPDSKLLFDNQAVASGSIRFEVVASGVGTSADTAFTVRDAGDSSIFDTGTITNAPVTSPHASLSIDFGNKDLEISGGSSKTLQVYLDSITDFNTPLNTSAGVGADYFQLVLRDEVDGTNAVVAWVANSSGTTTDLDTAMTAGFLRLLPMAGYQFTAQ